MADVELTLTLTREAVAAVKEKLGRVTVSAH
jgi:hypothetical protein